MLVSNADVVRLEVRIIRASNEALYALRCATRLHSYERHEKLNESLKLLRSNSERT